MEKEVVYCVIEKALGAFWRYSERVLNRDIETASRLFDSKKAAEKYAKRRGVEWILYPDSLFIDMLEGV